MLTTLVLCRSCHRIAAPLLLNRLQEPAGQVNIQLTESDDSD
jgi:hypothetical protein